MGGRESFLIIRREQWTVKPEGEKSELSTTVKRCTTAPPTLPPPQSIKMRRPAPNYPPFVLAVSKSLCFPNEKEVIRMYRQTYRIPQSLEVSGHTLLGFSFLIGTFNQQYRLVILSFITKGS
jgi:hypothetical protein